MRKKRRSSDKTSFSIVKVKFENFCPNFNEVRRSKRPNGFIILFVSTLRGVGGTCSFSSQKF